MCSHCGMGMPAGSNDPPICETCRCIPPPVTQTLPEEIKAAEADVTCLTKQRSHVAILLAEEEKANPASDIAKNYAKELIQKQELLELANKNLVKLRKRKAALEPSSPRKESPPRIVNQCEPTFQATQRLPQQSKKAGIKKAGAKKAGVVS